MINYIIYTDNLKINVIPLHVKSTPTQYARLYHNMFAVYAIMLIYISPIIIKYYSE